MKINKILGYLLILLLVSISGYFVLSSFNLVPYIINNQEIMVIDIIIIGFILFITLHSVHLIIDMNAKKGTNFLSDIELSVKEDLIDTRFMENHKLMEAPNVYIGLQNFFKESNSFKDLMDRLLISASKLTGSGRGSILLYNKKADKLYIYRTLGWSKEKLSSIAKIVEVTPGEGIAGRVFSNGTPLIMNDISQLEGFEPKENYKSDSFISLPISSLYQIIGVLNLTDKVNGEKYTEKDINILKFICNETSVYSSIFLKELY